jgi:hypothetical protein
MATYVNDLRLKEISTGDESGTWGTSTNTNLELIGEALGYATQQVFGSDADATTTIADGASDPARAMYFKITSAGSLTATRTCTIAPNTVSRVMFIENATSGSQSIAISQGSGASVTILTGKTAVVYLDGAGATAAVVDAMSGVDPGVTDTLTEVLVAGNTSGGTNIELSTTDKVQFRDAAIYINSSVDGQLDIVADTEIQIAATTIDVNGTLAFDSLKGTGATTVTNILDEDNMASDSATAIATQQSIKAYVDSQVGSFDTLAEVLAQGNTTGGTDLAVSTGDDITFADSSKAIFGAGSDLEIYHDGSNSYIKDQGTGNLNIQTNGVGVVIADTSASDLAVFNAGNGQVSLYNSGSLKLATTATGIDVTGTVTADGGLIEGSTGLTIRNDAVGANEPKLVFDNDTFAGATYGQIQTGNGGLQLLIESPSTSTFQNRHQLVLNGGGSTDVTFKLSTDNGTSYKNQLQINNNDISFYEDTGTTPKFFWDASAESLGIGTSSPDYLLEVEKANGDHTSTAISVTNSQLGGYGSTLNFISTRTDTSAHVVAARLRAAGNDSWNSDASTDSNLYFATVSANTLDDRMTILHNGNVGIGTTTPSDILHIKGASSANIIIDAPTDNASLTLQCGSSDAGAEGAFVQFIQNTTAKWQMGMNTDNTFRWYNYNTSSEAMQIDSSGNLGIGVVPSSWNSGYKAMQLLTGALYGTSSRDTNLGANVFVNAGGGYEYIQSSFATNYTQFNGVHSWYTAPSGTAGDAISFTQAMTLDASGNLYLGATSGARGSASTRQLTKLGTGQAYLEIQSASTSSTDDGILFSDGSGGNYGLVGYNHNSDALNFFTASAERMRINSSGNLLVGCTAVPSTSIEGFCATGTSSGNLSSSGASTSAYNHWLFVNGNGTVGSISTSSSATTYSTSSDQRLKENIADADDAGSKVDAIQVRKYDWIGDGSHQDYGLVAQELQPIAPLAVSGDANSEEMMGVDYSKLVPMMLKEIQSLRARVAQLES